MPPHTQSLTSEKDSENIKAREHKVLQRKEQPSNILNLVCGGEAKCRGGQHTADSDSFTDHSPQGTEGKSINDDEWEMKENKRARWVLGGPFIALNYFSILFINMIGRGPSSQREGGYTETVWPLLKQGSLQMKSNPHGSLSNRCSSHKCCCKWVKFQFWEDYSFIVRALFVSI